MLSAMGIETFGSCEARETSRLGKELSVSEGRLYSVQLFYRTFNRIYTGCPRRNDFGRVFLKSNYTDITQNTYIQSGTVTEIMAREV